MICLINYFHHGPLARYVTLRAAHAPGMPGTFSPLPHVSDPGIHHGTCVRHVPWCMPGSLTSGFLWSRWRGKRSRHSRRMRNPQFYVSGKRPMGMGMRLIVCIMLSLPKCIHLQYVPELICYNHVCLLGSQSWWRHHMETFPRYWPFVRRLHRSPMNSPQKGHWRWAIILFWSAPE